MYEWELSTAACPPFVGPPEAVCQRPGCGLEKWKHHVMAFWVCDGACFLHVMYRPGSTKKGTYRSWVDRCHGCDESMGSLCERWYAHRWRLQTSATARPMHLPSPQPKFGHKPAPAPKKTSYAHPNRPGRRDRTHHKKRMEGYPDMLFPFLPRGRHVICNLHGMEKIASWVVCTLYDFLERYKIPGSDFLGHR